jgi:4-hydroxybenzoyl-CoA thioesterase
MHVNRRRIYVEWGHCDPAGIVFYPRFFEYFDACSAALFASVGIDVHAMQRSGEIAGIPMVGIEAKFLAAVRFGEEVVVDSQIARFGRTSFTIRHRLSQGDALAVDVLETRVWTEIAGDTPSGLRAAPLPGDTVARLSGP